LRGELQEAEAVPNHNRQYYNLVKTFLLKGEKRKGAQRKRKEEFKR